MSAAYYRVGDLYFDTAAKALYRCKTAGDKAASEWDKISGATQDFKLISDGGDYYNCHTWDGLTEGSTIIKVAKHQDIRCILSTATPAGGAWATKTKRTLLYNYTYSSVAGSTADGVNVIEYLRNVEFPSDVTKNTTSYITPVINTGDIITAFATSFVGPDTLVDVTWQALSDGRAWADDDVDA